MRAVAAFIYDFVVGEDALIAIFVVAGLVTTAALTSGAINAWWVMPVAVVLGLGSSVLRGAGR